MSQQILYVQYTNPAAYPPLEHSSRILADRGWKVRFLGTGSQGQTDSFRFPTHPNIEVRLWRYRPPGLAQKIQFVLFTLWTIACAWRWRIRWIYASDHFACPAARLAQRILGCDVIYHEHDSPPCAGAPGSSGPPLSAFMRLLLRSRQSLARLARACVLPNAHRIEEFRTETGAENVLRVWNCPERREVAPPPSREWRPRLFYHGSLNAARLPFSVLEALASLPDVELNFAGYTTIGNDGFLADFLDEARRLGIADRVRYRGAAVGREDLLRTCADCTIGMAFMPARSDDLNMRAMAGASNKPFDYLACGLALLVSDLPEWRQMFVDPGYALACDPSEASSVAAAIRRLIEDPALARSMGERGRERIRSEWNYETQFAPLLAILEA